MTHGPKQRVMITTPGAPKAECTLSSKSMAEQHFTTPEAIELPRSSEVVEVHCHKKCFYDEIKTFTPVINGEDLASNGFFGGAAPLAIDLTTKKAYNYSYDLTIEMKPNRRCRAKRKGFLDGDPKDFDNRIDDFTFDDGPKPLPDATSKNTESMALPTTADKKEVK